MNKAELQYIADSLLLQKIATMDAGLRKEAGVVDFFRDAVSTIVSEVKERVAQEGVLGTALTYFTISKLTQLWWPLGLLFSVASEWGMSPGNILNHIKSALMPKIEKGEAITPDEVNAITRAAVQSEVNEVMDANDVDLLGFLHKAEAQGQLLSLMRTAGPRRGRGFGSGLINLISSSGSKGKLIIGGVIGWMVKNILLGLGLLTVTGVAKKVLIDDKAEQSGDGK